MTRKRRVRTRNIGPDLSSPILIALTLVTIFVLPGYMKDISAPIINPPTNPPTNPPYTPPETPVIGVNYIDFEDDSDFQWGEYGNGKYRIYSDGFTVSHSGNPIWDRGAYRVIGGNPSTAIFKPETIIVHSGSKSAAVGTTSTIFDTDRRVEINYDWDASVTYIWQTAYWYIPSNLQPVSGWPVFHRPIYERMWDNSKAVTYQYFQISIGMGTDGRWATNGQQIFILSLGKGNVDNNNDGITEDWTNRETDLYSNGGSSKSIPASWESKKPMLIPFNQWFKLSVQVMRSTTNGFIKVWINDELIWDIQGTRTTGINPNILSNINHDETINPVGYLSSVFGYYTDILAPAATIYVDDIKYGTGTTAP